MIASSRTPTPDRSIDRTDILVLFLAAAPRFSACAAYPFWDEARVLWSAVHFIKDRTLIPLDNTWPPFFSYLAAAATAPAALAATLVGTIPSVGDFPALYAIDSPLPLLPGRLLNAVLGSATAWVVDRAGEREWGRRVGLLAGSVLALSGLHSAYSAYALPDAAMTFWAALSLSYALRAVTEKDISSLRPSAVCSGLAIATKYNSAPLLLQLMCAQAFCVSSTERVLPRRLFNRRAGTLILTACAAAALASPGWVLSPGSLMSGVAHQMHATGAAGLSDFWEPHFVGLASALWRIDGSIALLMLLGVLAALQRREPTDCVLLALFASAFAFIGSRELQSPHYFLFAYPAGALLAARALNSALVSLADAGSPRAVQAALIAAAIAWPSAAAIETVYAQTLPDSRWLAHRWIQERIPAGSVVIVDWAYCPRIIPASVVTDWLRGPHSAFYARMLAGEKRFDVRNLQYDLAWLRDAPGDTLVLSSYAYARYFKSQASRSEDRRRHYVAARSLYERVFAEDPDLRWRLAAEFDSGRGPRIVVYRRNADSAGGQRTRRDPLELSEPYMPPGF